MAIEHRVLYVQPEHTREKWEASSRDGLRDQLVPQWCRPLWGDSSDDTLVPLTKFGWHGCPGGRGQPKFHYAEVYSMAVLEGRADPLGWSTPSNVKARLKMKSAPSWLQNQLAATPPGFETMYECFKLLGATDQESAYGDSILAQAVELSGTVEKSPGKYIRSLASQFKEPDVLALPASGGRLIAIETKSVQSKDSMKAGQAEGLSLLETLGFRVEVWWICEPNLVLKDVPRTVERVAHGPEGVKLNVRESLDWTTIRRQALEAARGGRAA